MNSLVNLKELFPQYKKRKEATHNFLPVKGIRAIGCSKCNLTKIFIYATIAGAKDNTVARTTLMQLTGLNYSSITDAINWLKDNKFIGYRGRDNKFKTVVYSPLKCGKEKNFNFNWNIFNVEDKYGSETAKAFGLYFYMRAKENSNRFGNSWCYLSQSEFKEYRLQLYLLVQYGLIVLGEYKGQKFCTFKKEYAYTTDKENRKNFQQINIELTEAEMKKLEAKRKSNEEIEKQIKAFHVRREQ